jgi:NAD(P)-dependent dehydrogenase (short-subunit alcohol dehydrogenase family)
MHLDFTDKKAVVTGGANGIGFATASLLAGSGAHVYILDLERENPVAAAERIGATGIAVDVTDLASIEHAFQQVERPDIVAVNAGIAPTAPIEQTPVELWQRMLDVNLTGAFLTVQAAAKRMKARRSGSIVLTASTNSYDGEATLVAYNATKAGILGILHTAANELGPYGVRVNAVCPGLIHTRLTQMYYDKPDSLKEYFRHIPMGRGGTPAEVANAIAFLASEAASFISGAALLVDGGQLASKYSLWTEEMAEFKDGRWVLKQPTA